jgi:hypothetical protein
MNRDRVFFAAEDSVYAQPAYRIAVKTPVPSPLAGMVVVPSAIHCLGSSNLQATAAMVYRAAYDHALQEEAYMAFQRITGANDN